MRYRVNLLFFLAVCVGSAIAGQGDTLILASPEQSRDYWKIKQVTNPYYPGEAARKGVEGCAAIGFVIESDGSTSNLRSFAGYPPGVFMRAATDAIRKWKFTPSETNPSRQPVYTYQIIEFHLDTGSPARGTEPENPAGKCASEAKRLFDSLTGKADAI